MKKITIHYSQHLLIGLFIANFFPSCVHINPKLGTNTTLDLPNTTFAENNHAIAMPNATQASFLGYNHTEGYNDTEALNYYASTLQSAQKKYEEQPSYELTDECHFDVCTRKITCSCLREKIIRYNCNTPLLNFWLHQGVNLNNKCGEQIAKDALQNNRPEIFMSLINHGLVLNPQLPWVTMVQNGHYSKEDRDNISKYLVRKQRIDINAKHDTPMKEYLNTFQASFRSLDFNDNKPFLEFLLQNGAIVDAPFYPSADASKTLLTYYISMDRLDLNRIKFLIENGVNIYQKVEFQGREMSIIQYLKSKAAFFEEMAQPYDKETYRYLINFLAKQESKERVSV